MVTHSALVALRDRVAGLKGPCRETDLVLAVMAYPQWPAAAWTTDDFGVPLHPAQHKHSQFTGSLDAADRFRQAVLPGSSKEVFVNFGTHVNLYRKNELKADIGVHLSEPLAIVLAVLNALVARDE